MTDKIRLINIHRTLNKSVRKAHIYLLDKWIKDMNRQFTVVQMANKNTQFPNKNMQIKIKLCLASMAQPLSVNL